MAVGMTNTSQQIAMGLPFWAAMILFLVVYGLDYFGEDPQD